MSQASFAAKKMQHEATLPNVSSFANIDSMSKPWFKLNKQKIGWVPISWQGWLLTFGFITFIVYNYFRIDSISHSTTDTLIKFIPQTFLFTGLFSVLCYLKSDKSASEKMLD